MNTTLLKEEDIPKVERLLDISHTKPLDHNDYVPWDDTEQGEFLMPELLVSLAGHPLYENLTQEQKIELSRHELGQVVYSYAWAEGIGCLTFSNRMVTLEPTSLEYKYLMRMSVEEFRHQEMFVKLVEKIKAHPFVLPKHHWFMANYMRYSPQSHRFLSILTIELMADIYGKIIRNGEGVFRPSQKVSQLHHIEEGRHIHYTKLWLRHYLDDANFYQRTTYSLIVLSNLLLIKSLYVREEIFELIGVDDPKKYAKAARKNLHAKFQEHCIADSLDFVRSFNGFNFITRPIWKLLMNTSIK